jgi:hypothetical protein
VRPFKAKVEKVKSNIKAAIVMSIAALFTGIIALLMVLCND